MPRRYWSMGGKERGGSYHFHRFGEGKVVFVDELIEAFQTDQGGMPFIAMVDIEREA